MPSPLLPHAAPQRTSVAPGDVVAFHTSDSGGVCLVGVVASTPTLQEHDGSPASVLVQPRPLLLVPPQRAAAAASAAQQPEKTNTKAKKRSPVVKVAGQMVDRTDPHVEHLVVASIPAPSQEISASATTTAAVTAEEMAEMEEQRAALQADLDTSKARISEIDDLLRQSAQQQQQQQQKKNSPRAQQRHPSPVAVARGDAEKAVDATERELLLARAGLRTVKAAAWTDLQRRTTHTAAPALVCLVEAAAALLHDPRYVVFDDVVTQSSTLAKRLAAVKSIDVTDSDRKAAQAVLQAWPTMAAVEKEHRTVAALHRWLAAVVRAAQAQRELRAVQEGGKRTPRTSEVNTAAAEAALRGERADQLEYVQMAEEEIAALDALIAEANAIAHTLPSEDVSQIAPALVVPAKWVVCVFASSDAPDMTACASKPRGTPVTFSLPENPKLVATVRSSSAATASTAAATTSSKKIEESPLKRNASARSSGVYEGDRRGSLGGTQPPTTVSSRRVSGVIPTSPRPSFAASSVRGQTAEVAEIPAHAVTAASAAAAGPREAELEEKVRLLEARLSSALQQNPKEAELQLLRDEVSAKRTELQRVTEERDRLLLERRERSVWGYGAAGRHRGIESAAGGDASAQSQHVEARGGSSPLRQPGSGRYTRQLSSPRDVVDRSIVEELEEQLTAAHQRISELQIEASQARRRPSVSRPAPAPAPAAPATATTDAVLLSPISFSAAGDVSDTTAAASPPPGLPSSPPLPAAHAVPQDVYDEVEARLQTVTAELESQRQSAQRLEEQLNSALHRRTEAEGVVAAQKRELEEVWERLEVAEALAEERSLLTQQRLLMAQSQQSLPSPQPEQHVAQQSQQQQPIHIHAAPSSVSTAGTSYHSPQQGQLLAQPGRPRPPAQRTSTSSEPFSAFVIPTVHDADIKSQANDDATTVVTATAGGGNGNVSRMSFDAPPRGASVVDAFPSFGTIPQNIADSLLPNGLYVRGTSAAALQSRPVEQLSTIELRHEVHRLREEVERHQSGELRLSMELQTIKEKQKAEHKRRRDARVARMQMLSRMQDNISEAIAKSNTDLEAIPALLERGRAEAEALMVKRRMHR